MESQQAFEKMDDAKEIMRRIAVSLADDISNIDAAISASWNPDSNAVLPSCFSELVLSASLGGLALGLLHSIALSSSRASQ